MPDVEQLWITACQVVKVVIGLDDNNNNNSNDIDNNHI